MCDRICGWDFSHVAARVHEEEIVVFNSVIPVGVSCVGSLMVHLSLFCDSVKAFIASRCQEFQEISCEISSENYINKIDFSDFSDYCLYVKILVITCSAMCWSPKWCWILQDYCFLNRQMIKFFKKCHWHADSHLFSVLLCKRVMHAKIVSDEMFL